MAKSCFFWNAYPQLDLAMLMPLFPPIISPDSISSICTKNKSASKWTHLFLPKQNDYQGYKASQIFLYILGVVYVFRSTVHTFLPDGGAGIIAGFDVENFGSQDMVIWAWAWSGAYQIIYCFVIWTVLVRYRKFIPAVYVLVIIEIIMLRVIGWIKPLIETVPSHTPPGVVAYSLIIPVLTIFFFILSLRIPRKKGNKRNEGKNRDY